MSTTLTDTRLRLEAATSRLEDIATSAPSFEQPRGTVADAGAVHLPSSSSAPELPGVAKDAAQASTPAAPTPQAESLPKPIQDMDDLIKEHVVKFVTSASGLDKNIETQVPLMSNNHQPATILILARHKPSSAHSLPSVSTSLSPARLRSPI